MPPSFEWSEGLHFPPSKNRVRLRKGAEATNICMKLKAKLRSWKKGVQRGKKRTGKNRKTAIGEKLKDVWCKSQKNEGNPPKNPKNLPVVKKFFLWGGGDVEAGRETGE